MSTILRPAKEPLNGVSWIDSRKLTTPVSEFSYTGKPLPAPGDYEAATFFIDIAGRPRST